MEPGRGLGAMPIAPHFLFTDRLRCGGRIRVAKGQEVISWGCGAVWRVAPPCMASRGLEQVSGGVGLPVGMQWHGWQGSQGAMYVVPLRVRAQHRSSPCPTSPRLPSPPVDQVRCVQANSGHAQEASSLFPGLVVGSTIALNAALLGIEGTILEDRLDARFAALDLLCF